MPEVLVIVPIHSRVGTLPQALESIKNQTFGSFEVQMIADGASQRVIEIGKSFTERDQRFHLQIHPKSARRGEEHRHNSILLSSAKYVTYLTDDDLFLPHHIQYMLDNIEGNDFANPRPTFIDSNDEVWCMPTDLSNLSSRDWHLSKRIQNSISLSGVMHSKASYLQLSEGWVPTPRNFPWTDLYMWQKFLRRRDFKFITTTRSTILKFLGGVDLVDIHKTEQHLRWFRKMHELKFAEVWDELVERMHQQTGADAWVKYTQEHDQLTQEHDQLTQERYQLTQERDQLTQTLDAVLSSKTWRSFGWYRRIREILSIRQ